MADLSEIELDALNLDEASRPPAPIMAEGAAPYQSGFDLATIHNGYRSELAKARQVMRFVEDGTAEPEALLHALSKMSLTENMRVFGSICGQDCKILQFHHFMEESHMFPELDQHDVDGLSELIAKLRQEHEIIHELLDRLETASAGLVEATTPEAFSQAAAVFDKLERVINSHFTYEETELRDALNHLVPRV